MTAASGGRRTRPYAGTGGRTQAPDATLSIDTQITAHTGHGGRLLSEQHQLVLDLCSEPRAVSELAGLLQLPVGVIAVLVTDLRQRQMVTTQAPVDMSLNDNVTHRLMERVHAALQAQYEEETRGARGAN
ncbi:DUF742 domain-containing protein [Streptomyces sp. NRRL F-5650]|uniref:DUF742 domain-containing protein n=1 Tax=Streptomyces sp. NRRL F-5650 TaxID=1463868 RepID=UPI0004C78852|nr:DUF742 domain-containing protein [Streptomyces sp. NRRL F-5650]